MRLNCINTLFQISSQFALSVPLFEPSGGSPSPNYKSRQSRATRAGEGATLVLRGKDLDHAMKKLEEMKAVTAGQMREAAKKYLDLSKAYELRVTP